MIASAYTYRSSAISVTTRRIMPIESSKRSTEPPITPYAPRALIALDVWQADGWTLKPYAISYERGPDGEPKISDRVLAAGRGEAFGHLRAAQYADPSYGLGFTVLHRSLSGTWLLTGWWAFDNILCTELSNAADDEVFAPYEGSVRACVHELAVVEFERRAWIKTMITGKSDRAAWTALRMTDRTC